MGEKNITGAQSKTVEADTDAAGRKALGVWCPRCQSRKVVEGKLGEGTGFFPSRPLFKAIKGKPVALSKELAYACARCGLTWGEVTPEDLQRNIRKYGLNPHSQDVMRIVQGEATGALEVPVDSSAEASAHASQPRNTRW
jgi:DNA-directed RNA polymerase subunit RPC12/RpoP